VAEQTETKRTRRKAEYIVESKIRIPDLAYEAVNLTETHPDSASAVRWIRKNGIEARTYRVIRVVAGPFTIKTESVVRRTLD
jgi:hypothetical protein